MHPSAFSFRSLSLTLIALLGMGFAGCAVPFGSEQAAAQTQAALDQYVAAVQKMDLDAIVAMVTPDCKFINSGQHEVDGPAALRKHLEEYKGYKVISYQTQTHDAALVQGHVIQNGTFDQQVQEPNASVVNVHGNFRMDWVQAPDGRWLIWKAVTWQ